MRSLGIVFSISFVGDACRWTADRVSTLHALARFQGYMDGARGFKARSRYRVAATHASVDRGSIFFIYPRLVGFGAGIDCASNSYPQA